MSDDRPTPVERENIATSLGRLLEGQQAQKDALKEIKESIDPVVRTQGEHSVTLGKHELRLDDHDDQLKQMRPVRSSKATIVATTIAGIAIIVSSIETWIITHP